MANANVIYYGQYPVQSVGNYNPNYFQTVHPLQLAGTYDPRFSQPVVRAPLAPPRAAVAPVIAPALRPEDAAAVEELGPEGIQTGKDALNVAGALVKNVFPETGNIIKDGAVQTKWGDYALPNPQDGEIIEKFLQATRSLINKMPVVE